jgi:hypothetical protein
VVALAPLRRGLVHGACLLVGEVPVGADVVPCDHGTWLHALLPHGAGVGSW